MDPSSIGYYKFFYVAYIKLMIIVFRLGIRIFDFFMMGFSHYDETLAREFNESLNKLDVKMLIEHASIQE